MRRVLIAIIVFSFLAPIVGCTSRSEYNSLVEQKAAVDKKMEAFLSNDMKVKSELVQREKDIKLLTAKFDEASAIINDLNTQLAEAKAKIKEYDKKLSGLK